MTFDVEGIPIPKGSTRSFYIPKIQRVVTTNANKNTLAWEQTVRQAAAVAWDELISVGPVGLELTFRMPRLKGHFRADGSIRPAAPRWPSKKPDTDKLARTIMDALTGIVYVDDAQVVQLHATKIFADPGFPVGATITIHPEGDL